MKNKDKTSCDLLDIKFTSEDNYIISLFQSNSGKYWQNSLNISSNLLNDLIEQLDSLTFHPTSMKKKVEQIGRQIYQILSQTNQSEKRFDIVDKLFESDNPLIIYADNPSLKKIPFELIFNGMHFLNLYRIVSRSIHDLTNENNDNKSIKNNILIIADPANNLSAAYNEGLHLYHTLKESVLNVDRIDFISREIEISELLILFNKYKIIHFVGHSFISQDIGTCLQLGENQILSIQDIKKLINTPPVLFFLNSCMSGKYDVLSNQNFSEELLKKGLDCVISSDLYVVDKDYSKAIFPFYRYILSGIPIGKAYHNMIAGAFLHEQCFWAYFRLFGNPLSIL